MNWHPKSFGGTSIDNGTTLIARAAGDSFYSQTSVQVVHSTVAGNYPTYATRVLQPRDLTISHQLSASTAKAMVDTLNAIYDVRNGEQTLIAEDTDNSNKQYYMLCTVNGRPRIQGLVYTITLRASIGIWRSVDLHTDTWNITASGQTHLLSWTQGGNIAAQPTIIVTPGSQKGSGYSFSQYVILTSPWDWRVDDVFDLTDGGLDTAALVTGTKAQADGDDFRVRLNGIEVDRRFGTSTHAFNQTGTYVQSRVPLSPRIEIPLAVAIAGTGGLTEVELSTDKAYKEAFDRLPTRGAMLIGSEVISWTSVDRKRRQLTGTITREVYNTSMGAHSVGDTCAWVEHEIMFVYGDASATAPAYDTTVSPIWDNTSTNLSHVYTSMTDDAGLRVGRFLGTLGSPRSKGRGDTRLYTAAANTIADPATVLGIYAASWLSGSRYQDEGIDATWGIFIPQGATTITATGRKRRTSTSWPTFTFEASTDGKHWTVVWTEATPSGTTDEAWTAHSSVALGATYYYFRFHMKGSVQAGSGYYAYSELSDITFTLATKPTITLGSEIAAAYPLDLTVTNTGNDSTFSAARVIEVDESLLFVFGPKTRYAIYPKDGVRGPRIEFPQTTQDAPLLIDPGANTIQIDDADVDDMDITVTCEDWVL